MLLVETIRTSGLDSALSAALRPWRKPLAVHDPGKIVLDLAVALALGGDCLADIACCGPSRACSARSPPTRRCPGWSTPSPRTPTGRWRRSTRPAPPPGRGCGRWPVSMHPTTTATPASPLIIDLDATLVTSHSEKEQAAPTFKRGLRVPPVVRVRRPRPGRDRGAVARCCCGPGTPARTPPPTTSPSPGRRWRSYPDTAGHPAGRKVLIRADSAGGTHEFLDWLHRRTAVVLGRVHPDRRHRPTHSRRSPPRCGHRPTTPTARSATAPGSPSSPACST